MQRGSRYRLRAEVVRLGTWPYLEPLVPASAMIGFGMPAAFASANLRCHPRRPAARQPQPDPAAIILSHCGAEPGKRAGNQANLLPRGGRSGKESSSVNHAMVIPYTDLS